MKKVLLTAILACGVAMAGEANATAADVNKTVADANKTVAAATAGAAAAADTAAGAAKFAKCVSCHGAKAEKKALGKSDVIAGWDVAKIEEALKGYKAGTRNDHGMGGVMKGQVAAYSDADIKAVAEYIHGLK